MVGGKSSLSPNDPHIKDPIHRRILDDENLEDGIRFADAIDQGAVSHSGRGPLGGIDDHGGNPKNPLPPNFPGIKA